MRHLLAILSLLCAVTLGAPAWAEEAAADAPAAAATAAPAAESPAAPVGQPCRNSGKETTSLSLSKTS